MEHITKSQIKLIRSLQHKKFRDETGLFVAEGEKCVSELSKAFETVMIVNRENATEKEIEQMSSLRTPQGVIGVFRKRGTEEPRNCGTEELTELPILVLDGVQDPGNLGTIIRTADWFGLTDIVCSKDTADCYNPKVVQATMGSLARVRVHYTDVGEWVRGEKSLNGLNSLKGLRGSKSSRSSRGSKSLKSLRSLSDAGGQGIEGEIPIYGLQLDGRDIYAEPLTKDAIIVMGNEGNGISEEVRQLVTHPLCIPTFRKGDHAESLNVAVATAITLSELSRR